MAIAKKLFAKAQEQATINERRRNNEKLYEKHQAELESLLIASYENEAITLNVDRQNQISGLLRIEKSRETLWAFFKDIGFNVEGNAYSSDLNLTPAEDEIQ